METPTGTSQLFRRDSIRQDGFVSMQAALVGGEFVTKPFVFKGSELEINYSTAAAGSVLSELQDEKGKPIHGRVLADCHDIFGDEIDRTVAWKEGASVEPLAGTPRDPEKPVNGYTAFYRDQLSRGTVLPDYNARGLQCER